VIKFIENERQIIINKIIEYRSTRLYDQVLEAIDDILMKIEEKDDNKPIECTCYTCAIPVLTRFIKPMFTYHTEDCALVQEQLRKKRQEPELVSAKFIIEKFEDITGKSVVEEIVDEWAEDIKNKLDAGMSRYYTKNGEINMNGNEESKTGNITNKLNKNK
jgi:hypothetical protein